MPADLSALFKLPPAKAIEYLDAKGQRLTWNWWEMRRGAHARAFTVAKVARLDILDDLRAAVATALREGKTERWFVKDLEVVLKRKGWWGKQVDVDPDTLEAQLYTAGTPRRLQTIYRTNLQSAYMAGRQRTFDEEIDQAPYVQYLAVRDARTRPAHAALHGKVFRLDDPAWNLVAPPNGFNCRCRMRNLSERELTARGLAVQTDVRTEERIPKREPPTDPRTGESPERKGWRQRGISIPDPSRPGERVYFYPDVGWDYNAGRSAGRFFTPEPINAPPPSRWKKGSICPGSASFAEHGCPGRMPSPRPFAPERLLPPGQSDEWYIEQFLDTFGATLNRPAVFDDVTGEPLLISSELFLNRAKTARAGAPIYKVQKRGRERYLPLLAETLRNPQEIWEMVERVEALNKTVLRRRYLAWWTIAGQNTPGLAVFEWASLWWAGVTTFQPARPTPEELARYIEEQRRGILRWKR